MTLSRKTKLDDTAYIALLDDISSIYEQTILLGQQQNEQYKLQSYWEIGRRIVTVMQQGKDGAPYGKQIIARLSNDMTAKYGTGFKRRTINYIRSLAIHYDNAAFAANLSWSHYRVLLSVKDPRQRALLEQRAAKENMSCNALTHLIRQQRHNTNRQTPRFPLTPRHAEPGIVKLVADELTPNGPPLLDLGFNIKRPANIAAVIRQPPGTYLQAGVNGRFKPISYTRGMRYCYRANLLNVIDGDTVKVRLHLGWSTTVDERMRLRGVDAMELNTSEGITAKRGLTDMLPPGHPLIVFTYGNDRYGRYVADLVTEDGIYINRHLVETGLATFLKM